MTLSASHPTNIDLAAVPPYSLLCDPSYMYDCVHYRLYSQLWVSSNDINSYHAKSMLMKRTPQPNTTNMSIPPPPSKCSPALAILTWPNSAAGFHESPCHP
jgi:hypothetical protein